jgi:ABC-type multidrug transport system fused ATPase/permease subunit
MKLLVKGEFTEASEKGANLSGGQKARICLARAIYSEKDILLLDDIISAVDVHVAEFLLKETIMKHLYGRTIVLATHAAHFAHYADEIIILKKGRVVLRGEFDNVHNTPEFLEVYEREQAEGQSKKESPEDRKISNDQAKVKNAMTVILKQKKS